MKEQKKKSPAKIGKATPAKVAPKSAAKVKADKPAKIGKASPAKVAPENNLKDIEDFARAIIAAAELVKIQYFRKG